MNKGRKGRKTEEFCQTLISSTILSSEHQHRYSQNKSLILRTWGRTLVQHGVCELTCLGSMSPIGIEEEGRGCEINEMG